MAEPFLRRRRASFAACAAAVFLAACGGGGGDGTPSAAAPGGAGAAAATPQVALSSSASQFLNLDIAQVLDYAPHLPPFYDAGVAALDNTPADNALDNKVATLGRVIFHDVRLSVGDNVACATCHQAANDFADSKRFSVGFDGSVGTRHAPRLANLRYWKPGNMFWDRRAPTLEAQSTLPVQNPVEMGFDVAHGGMPIVLDKMTRQPYYPELFSFAFGDPQITEARVQKALAQYMRAMVSTGSRWDDGYAQTFDPSLPDKGLDKPVPTLTAQEDRGRHLFMALPSAGGLACAVCHVPPTFALAANSLGNGLDAGETTVFKAPSLKNVGRSTNFMHDGRFTTLEEVVDHYASGVQDGPALDPRLKGPDGKPRVRTITPDDKAALVAFLKTLSDPVLSADPRFADPFRH
ncbi:MULTISPECIES: cytochrome c peroxidase [Ramlibacter]|uniref:Cytochrome-c peroxidase n=1 Tax=Ramlibacter aquaticus TaxID=2780094 RepID=A0ABR9SC64_9BURK|nr:MULTISPECIES: cytochrome c peroxidase [Ramlibacter]MBE7939918.1 cytochrome-c peroxidase [Ramlibacter aquaticus]